ncbi:MAG: hypothetical protein ACJAZ4_001056 [Neptuniibacter pectenicola]|jgi:hypothetical protein
MTGLKTVFLCSNIIHIVFIALQEFIVLAVCVTNALLVKPRK